jgi:hypothetical protein
MPQLQAPVVALVTALTTAVFVVPRPQTPKDVPYPPVFSEHTANEEKEIVTRAREASASGLHVDIRGIGERVRRVSRLETTGPSELYLAERARLRLLVRALLNQQREEELLALRDVQAVLFVDSLLRHRKAPTKDTQTAIQELGANVLTYLDRADSWLETYPLLKPTLIALFCERWAELLDVQQHLFFASTANAHRLMQRFLVAYQLNRGSKRDHQQLLAVLGSVPKYSPDYPSEYARGIVLYQMGAFPDAIAAFSRHLTFHPDGPWALRAHNFRLEATRAATQ